MLSTGTEVGGFRVEGVLGRGGMGTVYEATQLSLGRVVALKLMEPGLGADPVFRERFRREGRLQAALDHPHIVTVFEAGELPEGLFIAMRLIRGPDLKALVRGGDLTPRRAVALLGQVAGALDAAHDEGLTHRDIKPQNVLVGPRDYAYLADFGLTKGSDDTGGFTRTGQFMGTLDYVAPEQIQSDATRASDIYALAAVAYECLVGKVPFRRASEVALLYAHLRDEPPRASVERPELPAAVDDVLLAGLAKEPQDRPATAVELIAQLAEAIGTAPPAEPVPARFDREAAEDADTDRVGSATVTAAPGSPHTRTAAPVTASRADTPRLEAAPPLAVTSPGPRLERAEPPAPGAAGPRRRGGLPAILAACALVGIGGGLAVAGAVADEEAPVASSATSGASLVEAGALALRAPSGWREAEPVEVDGLPLKSPVAVAPAAGDAGGVVLAGTTSATGRTLLPAAFLERFDEPPAIGDAVRLGRLQAYRYAGLTPEGEAGELTVYAAPTSAGVATVVCRDLEGAACDRLASTLEVRGDVEPVALGPGSAYAKAINRVLTALDRGRTDGLRLLRDARRPASQRRGAQGVAEAWRQAARSLRRLPATPLEAAVQSRAARAADRAADAYRAMATAAGAERREGWNRARGAARRAETSFRSAVGELADLGYDLG